jgi:beta propeller repeat protein
MDDRNDNWDIYMYSIKDRIEFQITNDLSWQYMPSIHESKVVWIDERNGNKDIYMCDLNS